MSKTIFPILLVICTVTDLSQAESLAAVGNVTSENNVKTNPMDEAGIEAINEAVKEINEIVNTLKLVVSNVTQETNAADDSFNGPDAKGVKPIVGKIVYSILKVLAKITRTLGRILTAAAVVAAVPHVG